MMTHEEAIKCIEDVLSSDYRYDESLGYQLTSDDFEWLEEAKEALEKQLPRKPQDKFSTHAIIDNGEYIDNIDFMAFECPVCNGVLASGEIEKEDCTNIHYCENCGQAIDWSDT